MASLKTLSKAAPSVAFTVVFGFILIQSTRLRPISDDYCLGASALDGPFQSMFFWLTNWTGSPFSALTQVLFTSWPIAALPVGLSSSVSFVGAGLAVGLLTAYLLQASWGNAPFKTSLLVVVVATGWFVSFRVGQVLELRAGDDPIGNTSWVVSEILTHWQTVNSGYVTASSLAMLLLAWSFFSPRIKTQRGRYLALAFASLAVGWSTYVLAVAIAGAFLLISFGIHLKEPTAFARNCAVAAAAIFTGVASTFLFPGARARTGSNVDSADNLLLEGIRNVPSGLGDWATDVVSAPTIFALLLGASVASLGLAEKPKPYASRLEWIGAILLLASLLTYLLNEVVAAVIYGGLWHTVPGRLMVFVAALLLGASLVKRIKGREGLSNAVAGGLSVLQTLTVSGVLASTILGSVVLAASINARQVAWEQGPAEIRGITFMDDREAQWVQTCWATLEEGRQ